MRIQKRKVNKKAVSNSMEMNNITEERFVQLQAEAYYKAIKRIEDEKNKGENIVAQDGAPSVFNVLGFFLYMLFCPKKAKKKYELRDDITNSIFLILSSATMFLIGKFLRISAFGAIIISILCMIIVGMNVGVGCVVILASILVTIIGSMFLLSSEEIKKERDGVKIMNYTTNILAIIAILIAIFI